MSGRAGAFLTAQHGNANKDALRSHTIAGPATEPSGALPRRRPSHPYTQHHAAGITFPLPYCHTPVPATIPSPGRAGQVPRPRLARHHTTNQAARHALLQTGPARFLTVLVANTPAAWRAPTHAAAARAPRKARCQQCGPSAPSPPLPIASPSKGQLTSCHFSPCAFAPCPLPPTPTGAPLLAPVIAFRQRARRALLHSARSARRTRAVSPRRAGACTAGPWPRQPPPSRAAKPTTFRPSPSFPAPAPSSVRPLSTLFRSAGARARARRRLARRARGAARSPPPPGIAPSMR